MGRDGGRENNTHAQCRTDTHAFGCIHDTHTAHGTHILRTRLGGWGAICVSEGEIVWIEYGHETDTTNNRMELLAIIKTLEKIPPSAQVGELGRS